MGLLRILGISRWKPKEGIVYKSWYKGDSHFGKSASVTILYDNSKYDGTFRVHNGICEIRIGKDPDKRRLITKSENVSFKKKVKHLDSIWSGPMLGQNGYAGTEIQYTAKILDHKAVENVEM